MYDEASTHIISENQDSVILMHKETDLEVICVVESWTMYTSTVSELDLKQQFVDVILYDLKKNRMSFAEIYVKKLHVYNFKGFMWKELWFGVICLWEITM